MNKITIELNEDELNDLDELCESLNMTREDTARAVVATGAAYAAQRIDGDTQNPTVSIMLHSLLKIHKISDSLVSH